MQYGKKLNAANYQAVIVSVVIQSKKILKKPCHANLGLLPNAASVAPDHAASGFKQSCQELPSLL